MKNTRSAAIHAASNQAGARTFFPWIGRRPKIATAFALAAWLGMTVTQAQLSIDNAASGYTIDFDSTLPGVSNGAFAGTGFQSTPAAGQLDSDAWAVTGWSNGNLLFGGTQVTALTDYTRGASAAAVTTGGMYAFSGGNITTGVALGFQPTGGDFAPGTLTLKVQNNTGQTITGFNFGYLLFVRNDQARSSSFNFSYSSDNLTYNPISALDYTSTAAVDALGFVSNAKSTAFSSLLLTNGSNFYFRWSSADVGGSGSRDEFALDNIALTSFTTLTANPAYYWVGADATRGDVGTWTQTGGTAWAITDADVVGEAWNSTKTATFGGAVDPSLVTVSGTVDAGAGISFASTGYTLSSGTVNLTGGDISANLVSVSAGTATIASAITGTNGMSVAGAGTLVIAGADTHAGGTTIAGATLQVGDGATAGSITGSITNNGILTFNLTDAVTFAGDISGTGSVKKFGSNILSVGGNNSYTGLTTVSMGVLRATSATALGTTAAGTTVSADATLELIGGVAIGAEGLTLNGTGVSAGGALRSVSGANSFAGVIVAGFDTRINSDVDLLTLSGGITSASGNVTFGGAGDIAVSGAIAITGAVTKDGAGTTTLSGVNTYTGSTIINAGTFVVSGGSAIPNASVVTFADVAGATLKLNASETVGSLEGGGLTGGSVDLQANTLTVSGNASNTIFAGVITGTGGILAKQGSGTLTLTGANAYTGGTTVEGGVLRVEGGGSLSGGAVSLKSTLLAGAGVTIANNLTMTGTQTSTLLAGWDFQTTATGGTAAIISAPPPTAVFSPLLYQANFGSGTLYLDGTNGSNTFTTGVTDPQVTAFGGTTVNAGPEFSTTTGGAASLALANSTANGKSVIFKVDMTGLANLAISYATRGTATGFNSQNWEYSTDGVAWNSFGTVTSITDVFTARSLAPTSGLNNAATAYVRLTISGATSAGGNNRLDNIQFTTPGPLVGFGVFGSDATGISTFSGNVSLPANASVTASTGGTVKVTGTVGGSGFLTKIGAGKVEFTAGSILTGLTTLTTSEGSTDLHTGLGTGTSTIIANAETNIFTSQTLASLTIGAGGVVTLANPPPPAPAFNDGTYADGSPLQGVPEPGTAALLAGGIAIIFGARRRR